MAFGFVKKTWKDRISEYPTRRTLTKEDGSTELVTVSRSEGTVSQEGDAFSADNMNDLETRVDNALTEANSNLNAVDKPILIANDTSKSYTIPASEIDNYKKIQVIAVNNTHHDVNEEITMYIDVIKNIGKDRAYVSTSYSPSTGVSTYCQASIKYNSNGDIVCQAFARGSWTAERVVVYGFK